MLLSALVPLSLVFSTAARIGPPMPLQPLPPLSANHNALASLATTYYFDQLIDHNDPGLGTFQMRYWMDWSFYKEGGPIILTTPGESNADGSTGYLTNLTMTGLIAQEFNGATIVIEHRFFGFSNPYPDLTVASLKYLTIQQAIDDFAHFAQTATLPMPGGDAVKPDQVPWIFVGGSYSGALAAFILNNKPDVFWAGYSSSGVVESIVDFWRYFEPIREGMPANCSADVAAVIAHFDSLVNDTDAFDILKAQFGMADVVHPDDAISALSRNLADWQSLDVSSSDSDTQFYQFCDALEKDVNGTIAPASGFGLEHALEAWSSYFNTTSLPRICGNKNRNDCLGTYNSSSSLYTNTTIDNSQRSWAWMVCNEVGFFQTAAPADRITLVSRLDQPSVDERQCQWMFPEAFSSPPVPGVNKTNSAYGGWNMEVPRVFFATAHRDPWRDATMAAEGVTPPNIDPSNIGISDGFHCSDLSTANGMVDETVLAVQMAGLAKLSQWTKEFVPVFKKREVERNYDYPVRKA